MANCTVTHTLQILREKRAEFTAAAGLALNSRLAGAAGWSIFSRWAESMELGALPCSAETLAFFVTAQLTDGRKINRNRDDLHIGSGLKASTVRARVNAIQRMHLSARQPSPVTPEIAELLRGAQRLTGERTHQAQSLTLEEIRRMAVLLVADHSLIAVRNRALFLTGLAAALRNSETAAIRVSDLEFVPQGAVLYLRKSKTDQDAVGRYIGLLHGKHPETDVVSALEAWMALRGTGDREGPLFRRFDGSSVAKDRRRLEPERIGQIVQKLCSRIGLDPKKYSGHTLRATYVTLTKLAGADDRLVASTTGHVRMETLGRYFRKRDIFAGNAMRLVDL